MTTISTSPDATSTQAIVRDVLARGCASRAALEGVAGKWTALALIALQGDSYRFNALHRRIDGISEKMLSQTLQSLERDGMITREVISTLPARVEYTLTPLGERAAAIMRQLGDFLEGAAGDIQDARNRYDAR